MNSSFIIPDWPVAETIRSFSTTRLGGISSSPYDSLNLGLHVGDEPDAVLANRNQLIQELKLPEQPRWLDQIHGTHVCSAQDWQYGDQADAIISHSENQVCSIMTADCLPILLCNQQGTKVAAIHAGWRSLAAGIIEKTIDKFDCHPADIITWLGPAIGPTQFEVGHDVYQAFCQHSDTAQHAFKKTDSSHYLVDIYLLARQRLNALNVSAIFGGDYCTVSDPSQFFSYRRDGVTGRMASIIWIAAK